jgi:hypothetical protein
MLTRTTAITAARQRLHIGKRRKRVLPDEDVKTQ